MNFAEIKTQAELSSAIANTKKSATEWKALAFEVLGRKFGSGKAAREALHQKYSDDLLMIERIDQVHKMFSK